MKYQVRVRFYCGTGEHADRSPVTAPEIDTARRFVADKFGGLTEFAGFGSWMDPHGRLVEEPARIFEVITGAEFTQQQAREVTTKLRDVLSQSAVLCTYEHAVQAEFI